MKSKTLRIPCTQAWFDRIKAGIADLRPVNEYWAKRLRNRSYDTITFTCGYPKATDEARHYVIPWRGCIELPEMFVIPTDTRPIIYTS